MSASVNAAAALSRRKPVRAIEIVAPSSGVGGPAGAGVEDVEGCAGIEPLQERDATHTSTANPASRPCDLRNPPRISACVTEAQSIQLNMRAGRPLFRVLPRPA